MAQAKGPGSRPKRSSGDRLRAAAAPAASIPLCSVPFCPICMAVTAVGEVRPELVDHLLSAGREFLLAVRSVIDTRLEGLESPGKLERVTIE